ncbi:MAG: RNA polymerase sigma factor [Thioalkalivibrio sp.]|jgi:RNA polymerase sigma-70 factor (ECF subfamily)|nr:RNA polymerase sigma factor [Thioalkalivibrio sp.]
MATWFAQRRLRQKVCDLRPQMYRTAYAWCHDGALADDLVQEAMMKALTRLKSLQDESAVKAWVFRIMTNCYRDWGRRQRDMVDVDSVDLPCEGCPEQETERNRMIAQIHRGMAELSTDHRQVVALVDLEGFSYAEVSEVLDVPIGTVMSRLSRARAQLRKVLLKQEDPLGPADETPPLRLVRNRNG